jgi:hypothetical protein
MRYTLWLHGHLLGDTRLEHNGPNPNQKLGGLRPSTHGLEVIPKLCGFLKIASAVKQCLAAQGVNDSDMEAEATMHLLETTAEGKRFTELVKELGQLELREAGGNVAPFHTIVLTDLYELGDLAANLDVDGQLADGAPRYLVSATQTTFRSASLAMRSPVRMRVRLEPN